MPSQKLENMHLVLQVCASETGGSAGLFDSDVERGVLWIEGTVDLGLRNRYDVSANEEKPGRNSGRQLT